MSGSCIKSETLAHSLFLLFLFLLNLRIMVYGFTPMDTFDFKRLARKVFLTGYVKAHGT